MKTPGIPAIQIARQYSVLTLFDHYTKEYVSRSPEFGDAVIGVAMSRQESVSMLEDQLADMVQFYLDEEIELPDVREYVEHE